MEIFAINGANEGSTLMTKTVTRLDANEAHRFPDNNHFEYNTHQEVGNVRDENNSGSAALCVELASLESRKLGSDDISGECDAKSRSLEHLYADGGSTTLFETENMFVQDSYLGKCSSEWDTIGGNTDITAAFEGKMILEANLRSIIAWASPIAWKIYISQQR
jgi:hypothetical protein